ncbi:hypothetical protein [Leeuwenhoekiella marinoflava]|uniref:hypothetical protein n=1 Tax=Leeuwenhoekiella marinoflava TaxID=988 RepID=UPI0030016B47
MDIKDFRNLEIKKYVESYDLLALFEFEMNRIFSPEPWEDNYKEIEFKLIKDLISYHTKRNDIALKYDEHCEQTNKENSLLDLFDKDHNLKMHFLSKKLDTLNHRDEIEKKFNNVHREHELTEYEHIKATEKIIYLNELGIIDFLRHQEPFNTSKRALAKVLSFITGEKPDTLQSYLNPMENPSAIQKNNPLSKTKNVEKIKETLINIGFKKSQ